jgi:hypothetical protein
VVAWPKCTQPFGGDGQCRGTCFSDDVGDTGVYMLNMHGKEYCSKEAAYGNEDCQPFVRQ